MQNRGVINPSWLETSYFLVDTFRPAVLIHLAFSFPEERSALKKHPYAKLLPYIAFFLLFICIRSASPSMAETPNTWLIVLLAYVTSAVLFFLGSCMQLWFKSPSEIVKLRAKVILLGCAISASGFLFEAICNGIIKIVYSKKGTFF